MKLEIMGIRMKRVGKGWLVCALPLIIMMAACTDKPSPQRTGRFENNTMEPQEAEVTPIRIGWQVSWAAGS